ncbi:hypothetical protein CRG98_019617 [Punica granatum]|uniref:Uncharacterized protein n=1 Tax=Punica granatum TaxID=22663 RepID=A0A2I0JUL3_PUNGR|nr:hypothetical protein CRG98_019617 [Punica granatum]
MYGPECRLSSGPACALLDHAAWESAPSQRCVTDTREKESPLPIYDSKVEGRHPGTTGVGEQASDDLLELYRVSRGTFQWSQTPPGEFSGHIHRKQRSQRSPNASRHSGNTEKASESNEPDPASCRPIFPQAAAAVPPLGSLTRSPRPESCDSHDRFPDSFPLATRLGNIPLQLREARILNLSLRVGSEWRRSAWTRGGPRASRRSLMKEGREPLWPPRVHDPLLFAD